MIKFYSLLSCLFFTVGTLFSQTAIYDSGGPLTPEHAAYDVTFYDLSVQVFPERQAISGTVTIEADVVHPMDFLVIDLDTTFTISGISRELTGERVPSPFFRHPQQPGKVWIDLGRTYQPGERIAATIVYAGQPRVAPRPPWDGGFTWTETADGSPWIATSCQLNGSDIWWPSKDHVSDEPDSMRIHVRVPEPLVAASNGKLLDVESHNDRTRTYHWRVSTPINHYDVALNIAPYRVIEGSLKSVAGDTYPVYFWVLPEDYEKGQQLFPQILDHLRFYEKLLGPYPFRADKYGVAQTPHLGMEHQTIIAYGANFKNASMGGIDWGFDGLHHHELGHEWWGNLVTCTDWRDMWLHEAFDGYMQALYMEELEGEAGMRRYLARSRSRQMNMTVAPIEYQSIAEIYRTPFYAKGAWALHSLRFLIGDEAFFQLLRRMCYPDPDLENVTDGSHVRHATTHEFIQLAEAISQKELAWFFDVYIRQSQLPELITQRNGNRMTFTWKAPGDAPFPMPLEIQVGDTFRVLPMTDGKGQITVNAGQEVQIDPHYRLMFKADFREN